MLKNEFINDFIGQASKLLPNQQTRDEVQKSMQMMAQSTLSRLDLVTREEFDNQVAVLHKTRAKVEELEAALEQLSKQIEQNQNAQ
jgi:hypothetical protein